MSKDPSHPPAQISDEFLRLAYQSSLEDIRFFKRQQWMVTNYTLAIYGAVLAIWRQVKPYQRGWFMFVLIFLSILSFLLICQLHWSIKRARDRKDEVKKKIPEDIKTLLFGKDHTWIMKFFDRCSVTLALVIIVIGGVILSGWMILSGKL